jgi:hypothetical protein
MPAGSDVLAEHPAYLPFGIAAQQQWTMPQEHLDRFGERLLFIEPAQPCIVVGRPNYAAKLLVHANRPEG